jgi:hypothetical protein
MAERSDHTFNPTPSPSLWATTLTVNWDINTYAHLYGQRAAAAAEACRRAARSGDIESLAKAARKLSNALYQSAPHCFKG